MNYKIAAVFVTHHGDTVGNANRLDILRHFSDFFILKVFTNQYDFLSRILPNVIIKNCIELRLLQIPIVKGILFWKKIAEEIKNDDCDGVFLFHDTSPTALWLKQPCFQYTRQVHEMLGLGKKRSPFQRIFQKIHEYFIIKGLMKSAVNFVVSQSILEYLKKKNVPHLFLTPHGVRKSVYQKPHFTSFHQDIIAKKKTGCFIVSYTGWVAESRGLWLMLDSVKEAVSRDDKIVFVIVGSEDKYFQIIYKFTHENNLNNNVLSYGRIDSSLVPGILYLSDVCLSFLEVNPTYEMSPPQKIVEYFAAGKPVIANKIRSHELLISDGFNGFLVNENPEEVVQHIITLKNNNKFHRVISRNALETAHKYDFDDIYGGMVKQIRNCLERYEHHKAK